MMDAFSRALSSSDVTAARHCMYLHAEGDGAGRSPPRPPCHGEMAIRPGECRVTTIAAAATAPASKTTDRSADEPDVVASMLAELELEKAGVWSVAHAEDADACAAAAVAYGNFYGPWLEL